MQTFQAALAKLERPPVIVEPLNSQKSAEYCVIWLHGLGANGHDFESIVPELKLPLPILYIFPHAPTQAVTVNMGMEMPAWYDIKNAGAIDEEADWQGMAQSEQSLNDLVKLAEAHGVESNKILLAGFSQGGVIAYRTALKSPKPFAGVMALSTYLPLNDNDHFKQPNETPILIAHGEHDPVVPIVLAKQAAKCLVGAGYLPKLIEFNMAHQVCYEEIKVMSDFIQQCFAKFE